MFFSYFKPFNDVDEFINMVLPLRLSSFSHFCNNILVFPALPLMQVAIFRNGNRVFLQKEDYRCMSVSIHPNQTDIAVGGSVSETCYMFVWILWNFEVLVFNGKALWFTLQHQVTSVTKSILYLRWVVVKPPTWVKIVKKLKKSNIRILHSEVPTFLEYFVTSGVDLHIPSTNLL